MELLTLPGVPPIVDAVVKASFVFAATALVALSLRRSSAAARHLVWTLGLAAALLAPVASLALPKWELPIVRVASSSITEGTESTGHDQRGGTEERRTVLNGSESNQSVSVAPLLRVGSVPLSPSTPLSAPSSPQRRIQWSTIALFVWTIGAAFVLGRMLLGLIAVAWMSRRTPLAEDGSWLAHARELAASIGVKRVRFHRSASAAMPMAWGVFRSAVLMPADADSWPAHRLRVVLLHELAHVKRRDCLTHLLGQMVCAAYWFNPLAWMAVRRLRTERERACDDLVLAAGTRGSDYADQLLDIARVMQSARFPAVMAGASLAMAHRSQLEGRLIAILDPSVPRRGLTRARVAAAAALFAVLILAVASVQPWAEEAGAAAMKQSQAEAAAQPTPQPAPAQKPYESYPGQADRDNRRNAAKQEAIQDRVQGQIQGAIQGPVQGAVQASIQAAAQRANPHGLSQHDIDNIATSVANSVAGVAGGVVGGVAGGVVGGVTGGVVDGVVSAVKDVAHEVAVEHWDAAKDKDWQDDRKSGQRDPRATAALIEALKDSDKGVRDTAMAALVQMRDPRMFEPLVQALKDVSADVREQAAFGLGQLRDARAVEPLSAAIKDASASVRQQVVFALGQIRAAGAVDALTTALHDASGDVREQAAFALGQIRDKKSVEPLISALKDTDPDVRQQAAFALSQIRDSRAVEALVIALKDTNSSVREQVAFALGQIRDPRAIEGLTLALKDTNPQVRQQAAFALGQIR